MGAPLRLLLLTRDGSPRVVQTQHELAGFLSKCDDVTARFSDLSDELEIEADAPDLVVVLGGDGAILRACRQMGLAQRPILGVNLGRLGFLADLSPEEFQTRFPQILARDYRVTEHLMFECVIHRADGSSARHLGLNEVAVTSAVCLRMIDVHLEIDDQPVTTYSCDGLILSTPVGSTAHSLSAGGPILRQDLHAFVLTPICPHTLSNRPLVDNADCNFRLSIARAPEGAIAVVDGQTRIPIREGDRVEVRRAACSFRLARLPGTSFYATLHRKLGWAGQPHYRS